MKLWLHKIEDIVDKSIPYLVALLLVIILGEIFYNDFFSQYQNTIDIIDWVIVGFFVVDLAFKYIRIKNAKIFLKRHWIEIIAVFPFFLLFRLVEELVLFFRFGIGLRESQEILHTGVEVERVVKEIREAEKVNQEAAKIFKEIGEGGQFIRVSLFERLIRPISRIPRLFMVYKKAVKAALFYEKPHHKKS